MTEIITLVVVEDQLQEQHVIDCRQALTVRLGGRVVPVLDREELPQRLGRILEKAGTSFRTISPARAEDYLASSYTAKLEPARETCAIVALPGIDAAITNLAAATLGTVPIFADGALNAVAAAALRQSRDCVILIPLQLEDSGFFIRLMRSMTAVGMRVGVLPCDGSIGGRLAVLKTLLIERLPQQHGPAVVSAPFAPQWGTAAPRCLLRPDELTTERWSRLESDVLLFSGHSNGQDASVGDDLILCARHGDAAAAPGSRRLPCFNDGLCFRQKPAERQPYGESSLARISDCKAAVLVLSGCNIFAPGRTWYETDRSLLWQACQSDSLATLASTSMLSSVPEFDIIALAWLAEGRSLGEVSGALNQLRLAAGHADCGHDDIGPYILLGNPRLHFDPGKVYRCEPKVLDRTHISIQLESIVIDPWAGAFLRVSLPASAGRYPILRSQPAGSWCRGGVARCKEADDEPALFLWLGLDKTYGGELVIEFAESDAAAADACALTSLAAEVPFWIAYLATYEGASVARGWSPSLYQSTLQRLTHALPTIGAGLTFLETKPGILQSDDSRPRQLADGLTGFARSLSGDLLQCTIEVACTFGTLQFASWESAWTQSGTFGPVEPCLCGQANVWGQAFESARGRLGRRAIYQCPVCGPVGEDGGRRLLTVDAMPQRFVRGTTVEVECRCRAPAGEIVQIQAVAILESWLKDRRIVGDTVELSVLPSTQATLLLRLEIPNDITPGVYPFAALAIVNGCLSIIRRMVEVSGS